MGKALVSSSGGRSYRSTIDISMDEFINDIKSHRIGRLEAIAGGYFSVRMFSEKAGYSLSGSARMLYAGVKAGKLEVIQVKETDGKTARYYRPLKKK